MWRAQVDKERPRDSMEMEGEAQSRQRIGRAPPSGCPPKAPDPCLGHLGAFQPPRGPRQHRVELKFTSLSPSALRFQR